MFRYILRRSGFLLLTVLLTSLIIFAVTQGLPGDFCRIILGREVGEQALVSCRENLGLNEPLPIQYFNWLRNFATGDWGQSFSTRSPILPLVLERVGNSLMLASLTLVISIPLAVSLGVVAGLNENKFIDNAINIFSLSGA